MRMASRLAAAAFAVSMLPFDLSAQSGGYRTTRNGQELAAEVYHWTGRTLEATAGVPLAGHRIVTRTMAGVSVGTGEWIVGGVLLGIRGFGHEYELAYTTQLPHY